KQLGIGSTMAGQLFVGALGGALFGLIMRQNPARRVTLWTISIFIVLPVIALAIVLWPVLGTSYLGFPIASARMTTLIGFALSVLVFERVLVGSFHFLTQSKSETDTPHFSPPLIRPPLFFSPPISPLS